MMTRVVFPVIVLFLGNDVLSLSNNEVSSLIERVCSSSTVVKQDVGDVANIDTDSRDRKVLENVINGDALRVVREIDEHLLYAPESTVWLWHQNPSVGALVDMGRSGPANRDQVLGSVLGELRIIFKRAKEENAPLGSSTVLATDNKNGSDGLVAVLCLLDAGEECFPFLLEMFTFAEERDWVRDARFVSQMTGVPRREARGNSNMQLALVFTLENALNRMSRETLQREGVGEEARKALETYRAYRDERIEALRKDCVTDECRDRTTEQWDNISSRFFANTPDFPFKDPMEATVCTARAYLGLALDPVGTRMIARERAAGSVPK